MKSIIWNDKPNMVKNHFHRVDHELLKWASAKAREADRGDGWKRYFGVDPADDYLSSIEYLRLDKIICNQLNPSYRDVIFIEYLSPARFVKDKEAIFNTSGGYGYPKDYSSVFLSAMSVVDSILNLQEEP